MGLGSGNNAVTIRYLVRDLSGFNEVYSSRKVTNYEPPVFCSADQIPSCHTHWLDWFLSITHTEYPQNLYQINGKMILKYWLNGTFSLEEISNIRQDTI